MNQLLYPIVNVVHVIPIGHRRVYTQEFYLELLEVIVLLLEGVLIEAEIDARRGGARQLQGRRFRLRKGFLRPQIVEDFRLLERQLLSGLRGIDGTRAPGAGVRQDGHI